MIKITREDFRVASSKIRSKPAARLFPEAYTRVKDGLCACCGEPNNGEFTDRLSVQEFFISGLRQACQDATFVEPDEGEEQPYGLEAWANLHAAKEDEEPAF